MSGVEISCFGEGSYLVQSGPHYVYINKRGDLWHVFPKLKPEDALLFRSHLDAYDFALYELNRLERRAA